MVKRKRPIATLGMTLTPIGGAILGGMTAGPPGFLLGLGAGSGIGFLIGDQTEKKKKRRK